LAKVESGVDMVGSGGTRMLRREDEVGDEAARAVEA